MYIRSKNLIRKPFMKTKVFVALSVMLCNVAEVFACTNFLVTPGASADGSAMISYSADSHVLYGELYRWEAADHKVGEMLEVREWDTNRYLGSIPQVAHTYSVIGNMNEFGLTIAETTFGGREELVDTTALIDYGSLIYITLQRAKTAREAIAVMTDLVSKYGYYSEGESFSIGDPNEVWIMEMIGKGPGRTGAVWVAQRIPDGCVSGHANQARITKINFKDKDNCLYAPDVIALARENGYFKGSDAEFSFSDAYNPLDFGGVRFCDARVWSGFRLMNKEMMSYEKYAMGYDGKNRMPLYIKPDHKISRRELADIMRDHFEGTKMDMTQDVGAGAYHVPYRWRPLEFEVDGQEYFHERAIATQQTGFWFVAQMRKSAVSIDWFGCDDANTSVLMPMYCNMTVVPEEVKAGNGDMLHFSWTSAFWVFNWVAQMTYSRYSYMIEDVRKLQREIEAELDKRVEEMDSRMVMLDDNNKTIAADFFAASVAKDVVERWKRLGEFLMVKYLDGNLHPEVNGEFERNPYGGPKSPKHPGYNEEYYKILIEKTGDKLKMGEL